MERRRRLGLDTFDEVWEGVYHMAPSAHSHHGYVDGELRAVLRPHAKTASLVETGPLNLGEGPNDFRVPDGGYLRRLVSAVWIPPAAIVVEIVSPDDETYDKFDFYWRHDVTEVLVADAAQRSIRCWSPIPSATHPAPRRIEPSCSRRCACVGAVEFVE